MPEPAQTPVGLQVQQALALMQDGADAQARSDYAGALSSYGTRDAPPHLCCH